MLSLCSRMCLWRSFASVRKATMSAHAMNGLHSSPFQNTLGLTLPTRFSHALVCFEIKPSM